MSRSVYARCYIRQFFDEVDFREIGVELDNDDNRYWLTESKESFHGEFEQCKNGRVFTLTDNRFKDAICLPEIMVRVEC